MNYSTDAVLFDLDGTLVETNIDFTLMKSEMIRLAQEHGISSHKLNGLDILAMVDYTTIFLSKSAGADKAANYRETAMHILEKIEIMHAEKTIQIKNAKPLLNKLQKHGIKTGIVTRNCRKASQISLEIADIKTDVLICREDTIKNKPHPDPLFQALDILSSNPSLSFMVGDHLMDITSGKAAGMKTIGFLRETRPRDFFSDIAPDFIVTDILEVFDAVINHNS